MERINHFEIIIWNPKHQEEEDTTPNEHHIISSKRYQKKIALSFPTEVINLLLLFKVKKKIDKNKNTNSGISKFIKQKLKIDQMKRIIMMLFCVFDGQN